MTTDDIVKEFKNGWIEYATFQRPLLDQLRTVLYYGQVGTKQAGHVKQLEAPAPTNLGVLDLYDDCMKEVTLASELPNSNTSRLMELRSQVRIVLGYDVPMVSAGSAVCHLCDSALVVAADLSTDVRCSNDDCGNVYGRENWLEILGNGE